MVVGWWLVGRKKRGRGRSEEEEDEGDLMYEEGCVGGERRDLFHSGEEGDDDRDLQVSCASESGAAGESGAWQNEPGSTVVVAVCPQQLSSAVINHSLCLAREITAAGASQCTRKRSGTGRSDLGWFGKIRQKRSGPLECGWGQPRGAQRHYLEPKTE